MAVHAEVSTATEMDPGTGPAPGEDLPPLRRINVSGDLADLLHHAPLFRTRMRGYDRLQVDNYTTWVEAELTSARRQTSHLLARYGACAAELERMRRTSERPHRCPDQSRVSERLGEMLRLAAEEAAEITAAGIDEAERIVARAHTEAGARLHNVEQLRQAALAAGEEVRRERAEATGVLARARRAAAELLSEAAIERDRLAAQTAERLAQEEERARLAREAAAAAAAERLAAVQAEVDDLRRQRDEARESLRRLTAQIGEALQGAAAVAVAVPLAADATAVAGHTGRPAGPDRREPLATSVS
jgi:cell division septum initiation protein DivIVA